VEFEYVSAPVYFNGGDDGEAVWPQLNVDSTIGAFPLHSVCWCMTGQVALPNAGGPHYVGVSGGI
jgi:hypothetical protein